MKFSELWWHAAAVESLRSMVDSQRIPHALLLSGPCGIGKLLLARTFAQYMHCRHRSGGEPCGKCPDCLQHLSMNHPDTHYVYPVFKREGGKAAYSTDYFDNWKEFLKEHPFAEPDCWTEALGADNKQPVIYVDDSNEIVRLANLSAFSSDKKVFIVWQPEKLQIEAANKLLKILEEPFSDTVFILVSNSPEQILPTIYSRTRHIPVSSPDEATVAKLLRTKGLGEDEAAYVAHLSAGNLALALYGGGSAAEDEEFSQIFMEMMRKAYIRDVATLKDLSETIAGMKREKSRRFLSYCGRQTRENFVYNYRVPRINRQTREEAQFSSRFAPFINMRNVEAIERLFSQSESDIARNANGKIVCFDMLLQLMMLLRR